MITMIQVILAVARMIVVCIATNMKLAMLPTELPALPKFFRSLHECSQ